MLAPSDRTLYSSLFTPPPGFQLDHAVGTTFTLDLRTLLVLPLTLATQRAAEGESIEKDPVAALEAVRQASERLTVFNQHGRIHLPPKEHPLFSLVERCIVPVRARSDDGVFHPKVWVLRFIGPTAGGDGEDGQEVLLRVAVLSRNLTFDRSWDFALTLEGRPWGRRAKASYGLADLVEACPQLATEEVPNAIVERCNALAEELRKTPFNVPEGFTGAPTFHALGLDGKRWRPQGSGKRVLVVSPFLSKEPIAVFDDIASEWGLIVSRDDELNALDPAVLEGWDVRCVHDNAYAGAETANEDEETQRERTAPPDGLHAKMIALEHGHGGADVTWWLGSANVTNAAWEGRNVEIVVELEGRRSQVGIDRFLEAGFASVLDVFTLSALDPDERLRRELEKEAEKARDALVRASLRLACKRDGEGWQLELSGVVPLPAGVKVKAWPVTLAEHRAVDAQPLSEGQLLLWQQLAKASLTRVVGFEVTVRRDGQSVSLAFAMQVPCDGLPADRDASVVRSLVQSRDAFLRYLRFLLAGDDPLSAFGVDMSNGAGEPAANGHARRPWDEVVIEEMVRAVSRDPLRLPGRAPHRRPAAVRWRAGQHRGADTA